VLIFSLTWESTLNELTPKKTVLMGNLEDLERYAESLKNDNVALVSIREVRTKLEGRVSKMDAFESGFDRFVGQLRMSLTNALFIAAKLTGCM
jgi:hypothetical protein